MQLILKCICFKIYFLIIYSESWELQKDVDRDIPWIHSPYFATMTTTEPQWNKQPKALVGSLLWVAWPQILPLSYTAFPKQLTGSKTGFEAARTQAGTHLRWWGHRCSISCYMSVSSTTTWFLLWKTQWVTAMAISGKLWLSHLA